jgi:DNA-binding NtrC family response regulator
MDREAIQERFGIIGSSPAIHRVIDKIRLVSRTDVTVLVSGESGSGKELVAQAIHALSGRARGPLIVVNSGAIPEGLVESELFGSEKGSYTGADQRRIGFFEQADKGTIFLDEIGEMPRAAQVRLLRVLESGEFSRVGASDVQRVDVRTVAASNKDLAKEVEAGRFREDLYYRLSTILVEIPPLRERPGDVIPILESFLEEFARRYDAPFKRLEEGAIEVLTSYRWPGNVRELRNVAEQSVVVTRGSTLSAEQIRPLLRGVTSSGPSLVLASNVSFDELRDTRERELIYRLLLEMRLELKALRESIQNRPPGDFGAADSKHPAQPPAHLMTPSASRALPPHEEESDEIVNDGDLIEEALYEIEPLVSDRPLPTIEEAEKALILEALRRFDGNRRQTARALGISERTLYRKLQTLDIEV